MALKPTIYKLKIDLSDVNRDYYDKLNLTIAKHPSETVERMMARVLAYCINAQEYLEFTKGVSAAEDPDIWARSLDDQILLWIELGEPAVDKIKKATRLSKSVKIYSFNSKSEIWWTQRQDDISNLKVSVFQFQWESIETFAKLVNRTMDLSITISEETAYISAENGDCEVSWVSLQDTSN
ncbi:MAG: YaeQ family protein [Deltaproteobacteria bacterium]|nr:YaeQ family protein [Deltaproteobacteria bacterium]